MNQLGIPNPKIGQTSKVPEGTPRQIPSANTFPTMGLGRAIHPEHFRLLVPATRTWCLGRVRHGWSQVQASHWEVGENGTKKLLTCFLGMLCAAWLLWSPSHPSHPSRSSSHLSTISCAYSGSFVLFVFLPNVYGCLVHWFIQQVYVECLLCARHLGNALANKPSMIPVLMECIC